MVTRKQTGRVASIVALLLVLAILAIHQGRTWLVFLYIGVFLCALVVIRLTSRTKQIYQQLKSQSPSTVHDQAIPTWPAQGTSERKRGLLAKADGWLAPSRGTPSGSLGEHLTSGPHPSQPAGSPRPEHPAASTAEQVDRDSRTV